MMFGILILVGFGTIVFVSTVLVISGVVRNRKGERLEYNNSQKSYNSTPEHLRPHFVQKPNNFDNLVKETPENDTPFLYNRSINNKAINEQEEQTSTAQQKETNDFNSYIVQNAYTKSKFMPEETNNYENFVNVQSIPAPPSLKEAAYSFSGKTSYKEPQSQSYEEIVNKKIDNENRFVNDLPPQFSKPLPQEPKESFKADDDYGFSANNTIPIKSKDDVLRYLDLLKTKNGESIHYFRIGTHEGPDKDRPIEEYKIAIKGEEIANLYFNLNSPVNARRIPAGFTF